MELHYTDVMGDIFKVFIVILDPQELAQIFFTHNRHHLLPME